MQNVGCVAECLTVGYKYLLAVGLLLELLLVIINNAFSTIKVKLRTMKLNEQTKQNSQSSEMSGVKSGNTGQTKT